ncbi:enhanced intracellular survival protein Eis [Frankia sp. AiPs1]|uniref:GNAT family N-acetyltransferase n=1 Tax=Frankia sp. AiPs1 TaxID=573493 RepID=UPI0035AB81C4
MTLSLPIQVYAFESSPVSDGGWEQLSATQRYYESHLSLLAEENGIPVADVSAVPMRQNVRGTVYQMAGVAGLATLPPARRKGYARALVTELLGQMRDAGNVVSALYPFRPSFYQRFGYVGLPRTRTAAFAPSDLAGLLHRELHGDTAWAPISAGYETYREFTLRLVAERHGFAVFPDSRAVQIRDSEDRWLVTARANGEVVGAATYRITGHGGDLVVDDLLTTGPLARALLLQFFARHVDQVARIVVTVGADETPELWATDLAVVIGARTSFPESPAPMARILSLEGIAGMAVGPGFAVVDVVEDPFIAGRYVLDGRTGHLVVHREQNLEPAATLTVPGLAGLIYGVLDPEDVVVRGLGAVSAEAANNLRAMFPRCTPYLFASF